MTNINEFASTFNYIPYNAAIRLSDSLYVARLYHSNGTYEQNDTKLHNLSNHLYLLNSLDDIVEVVTINKLVGVEYDGTMYSSDAFVILKNNKLKEFGHSGYDEDDNLLFDTVTGERAYTTFINNTVQKYEQTTKKTEVSIKLIASALDVPSKKYVKCLITSNPRVITDKNNNIKELHCYFFKRIDVLEEAFSAALAVVREKHPNLNYSPHVDIKFRTINTNYVFSKSLDLLKGVESYYGTFEEIEDKVKHIYDEAYEHFYIIMRSCVVNYSETNLPVSTLLTPINDVISSLYTVQCRNKASTDEVSSAIRKLKLCKDKIVKFMEAEANDSSS